MGDKPKPQNETYRMVTVIIALLLMTGLIAMTYLRCSSEATRISPLSTPQPKQIDIGDIVALTSPEGQVWAANTEADLRELVKYQMAKDGRGISELSTAGRVFLLNNGTTAKVLTPLAATEIRLLDGDRAGQKVYVDKSHVKLQSNRTN